MKGIPVLYLIAGPNGSGKTTFAKKFLPDYVQCPVYINADFIAQGLSPFQPELAVVKAGRILLSEMREHLDSKQSFAIETTLAGKTMIGFLQRAKACGYHIHAFFLWVNTVELSLGRIQDRVSKGGHDIPASDVKRRFSRSITNFLSIYAAFFDSWHLFDNSHGQPELIAKTTEGKLVVMDTIQYDNILKKFGK